MDLSGWFQDLTRFWAPDDDPLPAVGDVATPSGAELATLRSFEPSVVAAIAPLQLARFGQPMQVVLDEAGLL